MNTDEILAATFADYEHLTPDPAKVLRDIRAELHPSYRHRLTRLAPAVVVVVIVTVALVAALTRSTSSHTAHPDSHRPAAATSLPVNPPPTGASTPHPKAAAQAAALALLQRTPLPPGAEPAGSKAAVHHQGGELVLSSLQAEATRAWFVPATVAATTAFARAHPASGFTANCTCGSRTVKWIDFLNHGESQAVEYVIAPHGTGAAIKITSIVPWVPVRPTWSYVATSATSVDVTVERVRELGTTGGAPTVHRTLTGAATQRLAAVANRLRSEAPSNCSGPAIMVAATDELVFHDGAHTATYRMNATNCPQFSVHVIGHQLTYLDTTALDTALLHELGLPPNYGH